MNKKTKALSSILLGFTLALTGCAGTKAEENHREQMQEAWDALQTGGHN